MCEKEWKINDDSLFSSLGIRRGDISKLRPVDNEKLRKLEESLNKGTIPEELKDAFNTINISVSENAVKKSEGKWVTTDEKKEHTYGIEEEGEELKIYGEPSFEQLIKKISDYVYDKRELDARFEIKTWLENLLERELFLSITKKRHRDHLLHACRMALLGERILQGKITYDDGKGFRLLDLVRELFRKQKDTQKLLKLYEVDTLNNEALNEKILQIWFIAALFHDVGFIYEAFAEVWENLKDIMKYPNFKEMHLDVEKALANFKKRFSVSDVRVKLYKSKFTREFDHSKIGACLISNLLGESNLICDMAAFITDHHSSNETLEFTERPLSFLMVLIDEIQEWERPVLGRKIRDQILSEKISKLSPFIEYPEVKPELESISLSSDNDKDFEIKMKNGNLNLDFTLDYGDNATILEKTDFSFPLMLYLKYKDLQRLRIGDERKLKEALREALEVSPLFSTDSTDDIITELNKSVSKKLERLFIDKHLEQALEKPKVQVIHKDKEWEVVDGNKKYPIQKDNGELIVNPDLPFNFSISLNFVSEDSVAKKWYRQCEILLHETKKNKNITINNWLNKIISYKKGNKIEFKIGGKDMPRVLSGDFKKVITDSHKTYLREEYISVEMFSMERTYEKTDKSDTIKLITKIEQKLKNNSDPKTEIAGVFAYFDEKISDIEVKEVKENGTDIKGKTWTSILPRREDEDETYKESFAMYIPFEKPLLYEIKGIAHKIEMFIPSNNLKGDRIKNIYYLDGIYNIRRNFNIRTGKIIMKWDKNLFNSYFSESLFFKNCTYEGIRYIKQNMQEIVRIIQMRIERKDKERKIKELEGRLRKGACKECEIDLISPIPDPEEPDHYCFDRPYNDIEPYHLTGFLWIPKD
ncbi:MAG: hypothetical protein KAT65_28620 [Methanophagales archaeon]|nr:hypothetical protein [Methanophagales archaeon]